MVLIHAILRDEDLVICTLARVYSLFDMHQVRPSIAGTLLAGASEPTVDQVLIAHCADRLSNLVWMLSKDGQDGINRPESVLDALTGHKDKEVDTDMVCFDSPEELMEALYG